MHTRILIAVALVIGLAIPTIAQDKTKTKVETKVEKKTDDKDKKVKQHSGAIVEFKELKVEKKAFEDSSRKEPLVIKSEKDAKKYLDKETLAKVAKVVDLDARHIVIFAWKGSGRDKITYEVMESYPEQVAFTFQAGRTRDLRTHIKAYSVRKNVKLSVRK